MTEIKRTEITIETHSLTIIRVRNAKLKSVFCSDCGAETILFEQTQAALIFRAAAGELEQLSSVKRIHRTSDGNLLCGNSLADYFGKNFRVVEE